MSRKTPAYLVAILAALITTQAYASAVPVPVAVCPVPADVQPLSTMDKHPDTAARVNPEPDRPAVVIMGASADLYLLFSHHIIGFNSSKESPLPEAGKIFINIR